MRVARYVKRSSLSRTLPPALRFARPDRHSILARTGLANPEFQFIVISLKAAFYENAAALVGIYRDGGSRTLTLDVRSTSTHFSSPFEDVS